MASETDADGEIEDATLECVRCGRTYPVTIGIPRFLESDNYASSFGYQWNLFKAEQIDCEWNENLRRTFLFRNRLDEGMAKRQEGCLTRVAVLPIFDSPVDW